MKKLSSSKNKSNEFGGYTRIPNKVIWSKILSKNEKLVLIAIMSFNPRFPSYSVLMEITGIQRRNNISEAIKGLVSKNILRYARGGSESGLSNEYKVYWDNDFELL